MASSGNVIGEEEEDKDVSSNDEDEDVTPVEEMEQDNDPALAKFSQEELEKMNAQAVVTLNLFRKVLMAPMEKRVSRLEKRQSTLDQRATKLEETQAQDALVHIEQGQQIEGLKKKTEDTAKKVAVLETATDKLQADVINISTRQTETEQDCQENKEEVKQMRLTIEEQGNQIQSLQAQVGEIPKSTETKPKIFHEFQKLVKTANKMGVSYTVGQKPPSDLDPNSEEGKAEAKSRAKVQPTVASLGGFLDTLDLYAGWQLFPVQQNQKIFKLVPGQDFGRVLPELRTALDQVGWWIARSAPNDFRRMEGRSRKFLAEFKANKDTMKGTWFELSNGYIVHLGRMIVPYFLIPENEQKWPQLFDLLETHMQELGTGSWVNRFQKAASVDGRDFVKKFATVAGLSALI